MQGNNPVSQGSEQITQGKEAPIALDCLVDSNAQQPLAPGIWTLRKERHCDSV
jgi:hypothetical protein